MRIASGQNLSRHSGFTLVELLVVITIIGILMGLLIPAVQAARETARRNQCSTQINNLAKATLQEEMNKKQYPGWITSYGTFAGATDPSDPEPTGTYNSHPKVGGWAIGLLPYLDAQPTYEIWTQDKYPVLVDAGGIRYTTNSAPNLAIMQCPSSPTMEGDRGRNSYISNNGLNHTDVPTTITPEMTMSRANGIFNAKFGSITGPAVRADDVKDGLGTTVLFSENLQAQPWHHLAAGSESQAIAALSSPNLSLISRFPQGFVWHYRDEGSYAPNPEPVHKINGLLGGTDLFGIQMNSTNAPDVARPSSAHVGGVNMGFADGASRFVLQSIDYRVYQAIMTPRGKSSNVPFTEYVLQGEAL
jgi:prepilin-type N-terminal cleavage/methylation domain-containing protein/prepilin-type processing-associated H-X9-DG protein